MKLGLIAAGLLALFAAPLAAQTEPAPATAAAKLTIDSSIEAIAADTAGKAVLDANFPGMTAHPAYEQFKGMSLKAVQPFSNGVITDEAITKATADLAAIK
jgi:hypothetical protein